MRMKVAVGSVIENKHEGSDEVRSVSLGFHGVCDDSPENKLFWDATPCLSIDCEITNIAAVPEGIKAGDMFYVDFTTAQ